MHGETPHKVVHWPKQWTLTFSTIIDQNVDSHTLSHFSGSDHIVVPYNFIAEAHIISASYN